jgi:acyl-CoA synthetase (AMP-forming)/AMP-acid ligase II
VIFRSPFPEVEVPDVHLTRFVFESAREFPDRLAIVDAATGTGLTFAQLERDIGRLAAGLRQRGLRRGQAVGVLSANDPLYPVAFHGIVSAGGVATTMNPLYTVDEIVHQLTDAGARYLLAAPSLLDKARQAAPLAGIEEVFALAPGGGHSVEDLMTAEPAPPVEVEAAQDLAALPYSSGTTGLAKGVMLSHRNLVANLAQADAVQHVTGDDRVAAVLPFFHIYGMTIIMNQALRRGATIVTMSRFDADAFLEMLKRYRITRLYVVPPIVLALLKHPGLDRRDLSSLTHVMSGAAPLDADTAAACAERVGVRITQGYGLTETSPATHLTPDDADEVEPGSIGYAIPNTECKLVDPVSGSELRPGEPGELWIRGPQVMLGYLNNPHATANTVDAQGFLHTGDIARVNERGQYFIVDRLKELIKYKGFQVAPAELEAILISHPAIVDAAVIGVPDADAGEIPKGFVVLSSPMPKEQILAYVAERVAPHKKLRRLVIVDEIPKAASGKILRRVLRAAESPSAAAQ